MNETAKKPVVTAKNILRILSVIVTIIVFCPTFLVSCSGQTIDVSVMTAVGGLKSYGETVVKPHPIMLICFALPVAIIVCLFIKKITDSKVAIVSAACGAVDLIIWFIFKAEVKKAAEENLCTFKTTGWFVLNILSLVLIVVISVLVISKVLQLEGDLVKQFGGAGGAQNAMNQMSAAVSQMSSSVSQLAENVSASVKQNRIPKENIMGYCSKCGTPLIYDNRFCTSCGTPVPENMITEFEAAKKAAEEAARKAAEEAARREEEARKAAEEAAKCEAEAKKAAEEAAAAGNVTADQATENIQMVAGTKSRFCSQCGAKLPEGAAFCQSCGARV